MNTSNFGKKSLIGLSLLTVMLAGCSAGTESHIEMYVVETYEDSATMGCMGTNWNTTLRADDGRTDRLCGKWGKPGDKISGCWISGSSNNDRNGFHRVC